MINLLSDEKCRSMIKESQLRLRIKKYSLLVVAILLTSVCVYSFSEITIQIGDIYFYHNLGLGWSGFLSSYILIIAIWIFYVLIKYLFQLLELQKFHAYMVNECDPLRIVFVIDTLIKKKLIKEQNAFSVLMEASKGLNHKERIVYLLRRYPKVGNKSNIRMSCEFFVLSKQEQQIQYPRYYNDMKMWFKNKRKTIKKSKQIDLFEKVEKTFDVECLFYLKDYSMYLERVGEIKDMTPIFNVSCHLTMAKCYMALNDQEKAEECLRYVLEHGNTSYFVEEAKQIMNEMKS